MAKKTEQATKVKKVTVKKKKNAAPPKVLMHIKATYNNTIVSATDYNGNLLSISSCGAMGFAGSKKSTAYASTRAGEDAAQKAMDQGAREAEVIVKGVGVGRQAAIKGIRQAG